MTSTEQSLVLVATDDEGGFLVLGETFPDESLDELESLSLVDKNLRADIGQAVSKSTVIANLGLQGVNSALSAQGLVRLAPETLAAMKAGAEPMQAAAGWYQGVLTVNGKIVQHVRWIPAGTVGGVAALAAIGPAVALLMVQWQLSEIARQLNCNIQLTTKVLEELRSKEWTAASGHHELVMKHFEIARKTQSVSPELWEHLQAQGIAKEVAAHKEQFKERVLRHTEHLKSLRNARARGDWLRQHGLAVVRDGLSLLITQQTNLVYHALWIAYLSTTDNTDSTAQEVRAIAQNVVDSHRESHQRVRPLLADVVSTLGMISECPGTLGLKVFRKCARLNN